MTKVIAAFAYPITRRVSQEVAIGCPEASMMKIIITIAYSKIKNATMKMFMLP